jgi:hypothetical protein
MKRSIILLSLFVAVAAHADPPTQQSVDALFDVMRTGALVKAAAATIEPYLRDAAAKATASDPLTPEQSRTLDGFITRYAGTLKDGSWDKLRPMYAAIYMEAFSQDDIDALTAFYRSPAGQDYLDKRPMIIGKVLALMQQQFAAAMPRMQADLRQAIQDARSAK